MIIHSYYACMYGSRFLLRPHHAWTHSSPAKMMLLILFFFHSFGDIVVFDLAGELLFSIPQVRPPPKKNPNILSLFFTVVHTYTHTSQLLLIHKQQTDLWMKPLKWFHPGKGESLWKSACSQNQSDCRIWIIRPTRQRTEKK